MKETLIQWTDSTRNAVSGCDKVSPGCDNCYAESIANRFAGGPAYPNGFAVTLKPQKLFEPLKWTEPRRIFVNSMSDGKERCPACHCQAMIGLTAENAHLRTELATEQGLRLAMERQAIGIDEQARARINDAKAILTEAMRANRVQPWPKAGILGLCKQVAQTLAHWSGVIGSRDQALKKAHDRRRFFKKKYEETLVHLTNAEEGLQQLQEFVQADSNDTRLREMKLDKTGLMIAVENNFGIKLLVWNLLAMTEACQNYLQTEVQPEFSAVIQIGYDRAWRYFLTVVKPGGKSPHELRTEAEAANARLREALEAVLPEADRLRCRKFSRGEAVLGGDWDCCDWREWHARAEAALRGESGEVGNDT